MKMGKKIELPSRYWESGCEEINENLTDEQIAENIKWFEENIGTDELPFD